MTGSTQVGSLRRQPPTVLAGKCADRIMGSCIPRAVTLDPEGRVHIEPLAEAAECDVVGVYRGDGLLALTRIILEDLRFEIQARGMGRRP